MRSVVYRGERRINTIYASRKNNRRMNTQWTEWTTAKITQFMTPHCMEQIIYRQHYDSIYRDQSKNDRIINTGLPQCQWRPHPIRNRACGEQRWNIGQQHWLSSNRWWTVQIFALFQVPRSVVTLRFTTATAWPRRLVSIAIRLYQLANQCDNWHQIDQFSRQLSSWPVSDLQN